VVSVWTEWAARVLHTSEAGVYRHGALVAMWGLLCANILAATVARVPWRAASAGAWCSHLGVLLLAAGALRYGVLGLSGFCEAWRMAPTRAAVSAAASASAPAREAKDERLLGPAFAQRWTPITHFYTEESPRAEEAGGPEEVFGRALPATVEVLRAEYVPQPGSDMPRDYVCEARVAWPDGREELATISLNHPLRVGPYQLSQGRWLPSAQRPMRIVLLVRSRPGLPLIWAGMALIVAGMLFAFYAKPLLLRRAAAARARKEALP
jgi:hypothetical protein